MAAGHKYTREELSDAVASSRSWRGVLRALGRSGASAGTLRAVRRRVDAFGIDHSHFTGQRRWSERQLIDAIANAHTWVEVLEQLKLSDGGRNLRAVRTHAARLAVETSHLNRNRAQSESPLLREPQLSCLRTAGPTLAAAWFMLRGYEVLWPLEPCRYDLAVRTDNGFQRVQVKTATYRSDGTYIAHLANSRRQGRLIYDVGELDCFFVIDAELNAYLIPHADVSGYQTIALRHYVGYLVAEGGQWLRQPDVRRAAS